MGDPVERNYNFKNTDRISRDFLFGKRIILVTFARAIRKSRFSFERFENLYLTLNILKSMTNAK